MSLCAPQRGRYSLYPYHDGVYLTLAGTGTGRPLDTRGLTCAIHYYVAAASRLRRAFAAHLCILQTIATCQPFPPATYSDITELVDTSLLLSDDAHIVVAFEREPVVDRVAASV